MQNPGTAAAARRHGWHGSTAGLRDQTRSSSQTPSGRGDGCNCCGSPQGQSVPTRSIVEMCCPAIYSKPAADTYPQNAFGRCSIFCSGSAGIHAAKVPNSIWAGPGTILKTTPTNPGDRIEHNISQVHVLRFLCYETAGYVHSNIKAGGGVAKKDPTSPAYEAGTTVAARSNVPPTRGVFGAAEDPPGRHPANRSARTAPGGRPPLRLRIEPWRAFALSSKSF